jgi:hypothetical protein
MYSVLIIAALLGGNHYSWAGFDSAWSDANNWGSMDYPQTGDDIAVGVKWGLEWQPVSTINLMGARSVEIIDVWPDYETTLTGGSITAGEICGGGTLIVDCNLTTGSIQVDTLKIGRRPNEVPEPSEALLTALFAIAYTVFGLRRWAC